MVTKDTAKDFAWFNSMSFSDYTGALQSNPNVDEETICFVADTGKIYTHATEFCGRINQEDFTYSGSKYININNRIVNLDYDKLKTDLISAFGSSSNIGKTYQSGDRFITVTTSNPGKILLNISELEDKLTQDGFKGTSSLRLGDLTDVNTSGARTGQVLKYVSGTWVPRDDEQGTGDGTSTQGRVTTKSYFKNVEIGQTPQQPTTTNVFDTWSEINTNPSDNQDTWMVLVTMQGYNVTSVSSPINLTKGGSNGADTDDIQYIYLLQSGYAETDTRQQWQSELGDNDTDQNGNVFVGGKQWTNHPTGLDEDHRYEYCSYRIKTSSGWSVWCEPFLWSAWGADGRDGDGVEYIYYSSITNVIFSGDANPENWYNDEGYQTTKEYRKGLWEDNPIDLETLGQGAKQWVSIRKYDHETKLWGPYSYPVLWSNYAKNGVVDGYTYKLVNEIMVVGTGGDDDPDMLNSFTGATTAEVFHNGERSSYTLQVGECYRTDGETIPNGSVDFRAINNGQGVQITIQNLPNFAGCSLICPVTIVVGTSEFHTALTVVGLRNGVDGTAIDLKTSVDAVRISYDNTTRVPDKIYAGVLIGKDYYSADNLPQGFTIAYKVDNESGNGTLLEDPYIEIPAYAEEKIVFELSYDLSVIDIKEIPFVRDGAPAIGASQYSIKYINSNLVIGHTPSQDPSSATTSSNDWQYNLIFKAFKDGQEIVDNTGDERVSVIIFGDTVTPQYVQMNVPFLPSADFFWTASYTKESPSERFAAIYITTVAGTILQSLVIPIVKDGDDAEPIQGLQGQVFRFTNVTSTGNGQTDWVTPYGEVTFYNGNDVDPNDNIKYIDVVRCEGEYYVPVQTGTGNELGWPSENEYWHKFEFFPGFSAFETLIANSAYIQNLTAKQIVITNDNNEVVAGMADSTFLRNNSYELQDSTSSPSPTSSNGIRIWAGPIENGNVASAPFTVDEQGKLNATNAEITGVINATSGTFNNCTINDNCILNGFPVVSSIAIGASEDNSLNNVYLNDSAPQGSIINVVVLAAYVAHPICVYSNNPMRAYYDGEWHTMNNSQSDYTSRVDIQKPGVFSFTKHEGKWYVMLTYVN